MLTRLILVLLLAFGAVPADCRGGAMPAGCHDGTMAAMSAHGDRGHDEHPAMAEHGCIGCAALADWLADRVAAPLPVPAVVPVALPSRLAVRGAGPPTLRPPRIG